MGSILVAVMEIFLVLLIARAVFSWIRIGPDHILFALSRFFQAATEPVLRPVRQCLPTPGAVDFSLTLVMLLIGFVFIPVASRF